MVLDCKVGMGLNLNIEMIFSQSRPHFSVVSSMSIWLMFVKLAWHCRYVVKRKWKDIRQNKRKGLKNRKKGPSLEIDNSRT